jgi:hypothetical protein
MAIPVCFCVLTGKVKIFRAEKASITKQDILPVAWDRLVKMITTFI